MVSTFKGHGTWALVVNLLLAIMPIIYLALMFIYIKYDLTVLIYVIGIIFIYLFPHPTYLFFEIKHLILSDGIAEDRDLVSILTFGGLSLVGLSLQVLTIIILLNLVNLSHLGIFAILPLSFIAALGGCIGLTDLTFIPGMIWFPLLLEHTRLVLSSGHLLAVCIATTLLLTGITLIFI